MYENDIKLIKEISPENAALLERQNYESNFKKLKFAKEKEQDQQETKLEKAKKMYNETFSNQMIKKSEDQN